MKISTNKYRDTKTINIAFMWSIELLRYENRYRYNSFTVGQKYSNKMSFKSLYDSYAKPGGFVEGYLSFI